MRITFPFRPHHQRDADHEDQRHGPQKGASLTAVVDHIAKGKTERGGDQEDRQHFDKVGQRGWVFKRMRRVGVEEATAVSAEHLNGFLRRHRPHRQKLFCPFQRSIRRVGQQVLQGTLLNKEQRDNEGNREQYPQRDACQIDPCVAQRADILTRKGTREREDHRNAGGSREEVLHG